MDKSMGLKALGDATRLRIIECLSCCDPVVEVDEDGGVVQQAGPTAGEVCCRIGGGDVISSTVSHHLKELRQAGLIEMERKGRNMLCSLNRPALKELADYLRKVAEGATSDCC